VRIVWSFISTNLIVVGQTIAHYNLTAQLGAGGMGVVYLADDTRLERQVAIKFLPSETTAADAEQRRFEQEARAAARLNHTNICAFNEHEGRPFLVMEYVEGGAQGFMRCHGIHRAGDGPHGRYDRDGRDEPSG
jgi:serine/threonine protein kinase